MSLLLTEPVTRVFDLRTRQSRHRPGRCGRKFEYLITETNRPGTLQNEMEQTVATVLAALGYEYGVEDIAFQIIRSGKRNGKFGWKIPDFHVDLPHGVICLEVSEDFSLTELAALRFVREHYELEVLEVGPALAAAMSADYRVLGQLIQAAASRQALRADSPFLIPIATAATATAARRKRHLKITGTTNRTARQSARSAKPMMVPAGLQAARLAYGLG